MSKLVDSQDVPVDNGSDAVIVETIKNESEKEEEFEKEFEKEKEEAGFVTNEVVVEVVAEDAPVEQVLAEDAPVEKDSDVADDVADVKESLEKDEQDDCAQLHDKEKEHDDN